MIIGTVKKILKSLIYKKIYPSSIILLGANVDKKTTLGRNTKICKKSSLFQSSLGNDTVVHQYCNIANSKLDSNIVIYPNSNLSNVVIGRFSYVASNSQLSLTKLGRFCSVGPDLICGYGDHPTNWISTNPVFFSILEQCGVCFAAQNHVEERKEISIGHDVWIGARVFIRDGIKIGNGAIIGAGAVVVKDIPDYAIVGGVPAKIIRFRFTEDIVEQLLNIRWWNWSEEELRQAQPYFAQDDIHSFIKWAQSKSPQSFSQTATICI